jgi:hypothetical protein
MAKFIFKIKRSLYEKGGPSGAGIGFSKDFGVGVFPIVYHSFFFSRTIPAFFSINLLVG